MPVTPPIARSFLESRVLLQPPTLRDGDACRDLLASAGIDCVLCRHLDQICDELERGAAAVILPEESVMAEDSERLVNYFHLQPMWSDVPMIVLSRQGIESPTVSLALSNFNNVSLLERPVRVSTILSLVRTALRARERQYQVRDQFQARAAAEEALRESEARYRSLAESERAARAEADQQSRMKDEFLATLSHELRTPLTAILGWSHIIRKKQDSPDQLRQGLDIIERNARSQAQIIEDLLDMSRIISGKVRLSLTDANLVTIASAAVETVRPSAEAKGLTLQLRIDHVDSICLRADANRIQQVLWNLLTNAIKFTPRGGTVQMRLQHHDKVARITVQDSGEGIAAEFLPHIFDRFRQGDASITRHHGGLGLGLSIVKQLVELHGGTVRVRSGGRGRGSTFVVSIPVRPSTPAMDPCTEDRSSRTIAALAGDSAMDAQLSGVRVLVVDDEADARNLVKRLLEEQGAKVNTAGSVDEAIARLQQEPFDVVLSDIGMPGEDGYSLMRRLRTMRDNVNCDAPSIAVTAYARPEDRIKAIVAGFQLHLAKPVEPIELITTIASLRKNAVRRAAGQADALRAPGLAAPLP